MEVVKLNVTKWGKVIPSWLQGVCITKTYHILLLCFHDPSREAIVIRKKWEKMVSYRVLCQHSWFYWADRYLQFLERRMNLINQEPNDQEQRLWTTQLIIHLKMTAGSLWKTSISRAHFICLSSIALTNGACWLHPRGIVKAKVLKSQSVLHFLTDKQITTINNTYLSSTPSLAEVCLSVKCSWV